VTGQHALVPLIDPIGIRGETVAEVLDADERRATIRSARCRGRLFLRALTAQVRP